MVNYGKLWWMKNKKIFQSPPTRSTNHTTIAAPQSLSSALPMLLAEWRSNSLKALKTTSTLKAMEVEAFEYRFHGIFVGFHGISWTHGISMGFHEIFDGSLMGFPCRCSGIGGISRWFSSESTNLKSSAVDPIPRLHFKSQAWHSSRWMPFTREMDGFDSLTV